MELRVPVLLSLALLVAYPAQTRAGVATIERGAPRSKKSAKALEGALAQAAAAAGVCFRRKAPETIRVSLEVRPDGEISAARHENGDAVGQCLAGVLAVHTVPATGGRLNLTVAFDTKALGGGGIDAALAPYQDKLRACQAKGDGKSGGRATVRFVIHPDGKVTDPEIADSDIRESRVTECLAETMARADLGAGVVAKKVRYALGVSFAAGGGSGAGPRARSSSSGDLAPQKDGPHDASDITAVMERKKDAFNRCYAKEAKKNRSLAGTVLLRFTIRGDGTVRNVKIKETTLGNAKVEKCVVEVGQGLSFPAADGETRVFYPFAFSAH